MNPFRIAAWAVQLVCDLFAPVQPVRVLVGQHTQKLWPDGEAPLIDLPIDDDPFVSDPYLRYYDAVTAQLDHMERQESAPVEPMPGWFRGGFDEEESSAPSGSTASEAGVDSVAEGPAAGRAHTLAAGHPNLRCGFWCHNHEATAALCECPVPQKKSDRRAVTKHLLISAAIGLREFATSSDCEAPVYWRAIADQLDPK